MATNLLVTGSHGGDDPHVESKHDALMHAAMLGRGGYILKTRNWTMKPTAKDANNITIPAWDLVVEGRQIYIAAPTDVNIQSGSQGQKRRDLIVAPVRVELRHRRGDGHPRSHQGQAQRGHARRIPGIEDRPASSAGPSSP